MKISAKGRYALASAICLAEAYASETYLPVLSISERLGVSKIYLEQVFALLKRSDIVHAVKGAQGGYMLTKPPSEFTVYDLLSAVENSLFEAPTTTVSEKSPSIDRALIQAVFLPLDFAIKQCLENITLEALAIEARPEDTLMFYI